jgi:hypothetical protein
MASETTKGGFLGHPADPEFVKLLALLRRLQDAGALGISLQRGKDQEERTVLHFHQGVLTPELEQDAQTVKQLLGIPPNANRLRITYGADAQAEDEVALLTLSAFQVLMELASLADVPPEHVAEQRTFPGESWKTDGQSALLPPLMLIKSTREEPTEAFVRVRYRAYWFWIDDREFQSKRVFTFLMILFTLSETGQKLQQPVLTIRAN